MHKSTMRAKVDRLLDDLNEGADEVEDFKEPWKKDPFTVYGVGIHNMLTLNSRLYVSFLSWLSLHVFK